MTAVPDTWCDVFRMSVQAKGGTAYEFGGMTEEISSFDFGEKDMEFIATAGGGRLAKCKPMSEEAITVKVWPVDARVGTAGVVQLFHPQAAISSTEPITVANTRTKNTHQIVITWAENVTDMTAAGSATTAGAAAYRMVIKNAYMTSYKPSMDDKALSAEITFKWAPFDKTGTANKTEYSTSGGTVLAAVAAYS